MTRNACDCRERERERESYTLTNKGAVLFDSLTHHSFYRKENLGFKRRKNGSKGITLIALVVTIIILLILAGISITTLFGENGLIKKAQDANINSRGASVKEQVEFWKMAGGLDELTGTETNSMTESELLDELELNQEILTNEERHELENNRVTRIGSVEVTLPPRVLSFVCRLVIDDPSGFWVRDFTIEVPDVEDTFYVWYLDGFSHRLGSGGYSLKFWEFRSSIDYVVLWHETRGRLMQFAYYDHGEGRRYIPWLGYRVLEQRWLRYLIPSGGYNNGRLGTIGIRRPVGI